MKSIIVGTAGHIDHGKTALVQALTGIDADRLPEEKRRGITIDLGFADLDLGDVHIGFVDVPGHERFVKNMLAGAHGIDVLMLIVAADESVMPQTREHFDICRLLGVRRGVIVLTKTDLVDPELLQLARAETEDLVKGSFLAEAPIIPVSSRTGEGIAELKKALRDAAAGAPDRPEDFITRLPIDRAFTMKGFGAVITGTLISGGINEGDELGLFAASSAEKRVRVRGVQVHGTAVKHAAAGQRTALNLGGVEAAAIERGMVLAEAGRLRQTQALDAAVQILDDARRALRSRQRVRVHIGATEVLARVRVLEGNGEIKAGAEGFAQLRFESPIIGVLGDRFIIRSYSPPATVGGGKILDPFAVKHRSRDLSSVRDALRTLDEGNRTQQLAQFVLRAGSFGLTREDLAARTAWRDRVIAAVEEGATEEGVISLEGTMIAPAAFDELQDRIVTTIRAYHQSEPLARGMSREVLRERFFNSAAPDLFRKLIAAMENAGSLVAEKDVVRLREHSRELSDEDARLRNSLEEIYLKAGLAAPSLSEALAAANVSAPHGRKVLQLLLDSGVLVRVHGDMLFHHNVLADLARKIQAYRDSQANRSIDVGSFKNLAGISRKYAIPLLEYLDRQRVTRREGDVRVIL